MKKPYSQAYPDRIITAGPGFKMIEVYDLHYQGGGSDKTYTLTLQEHTSTPDENTRYHAICYYGRRGTSPSTNHLGSYKDLASAHKEMVKQLKAKRRKGYQDVGHYLDEDAKASANGALGSKVLSFLRETYPVNSTVESPTGNKGVVVGVSDNGSLVVSFDDKEMEIPFGKYGALKVVS